jgi:DNA-binding response OmpR family regulator
VNTAADGETGLQLAQVYDYDLILLDVMIPKLDGISLCRELRSRGCQMPILLLTALDSSKDRVQGLEAGADDYVAKPFNLPELIARIRALLRRGKTALTNTNLTWEKLLVNPDTTEVSYGEKLLHLTPKEYNLLELFLRNPRRIFSRSAMLDRVWSAGEFPQEEAVTAHIKGLRHKLKAAGMTVDLIETVYGLGYRLKNLPEEMEEKKDAIPQLPQNQKILSGAIGARVEQPDNSSNIRSGDRQFENGSFGRRTAASSPGSSSQISRFFGNFGNAGRFKSSPRDGAIVASRKNSRTGSSPAT